MKDIIFSEETIKPLIITYCRIAISKDEVCWWDIVFANESVDLCGDWSITWMEMFCNKCKKFYKFSTK